MFNKWYTEEFRINAVRLVVESGYFCRKAANRLGIAEQTLRNWIHKLRAQGKIPPEVETAPVAEELKALRREVAELEVFKYIEMFYNLIRRYESLNWVLPVELEENRAV